MGKLFYVSLLVAFSTAFASVSSVALAQDQNDVVVTEISNVGESETNLQNRLSTNSLSGSRLDREKKSTLGETLSNQPGVTSSQFGPNASRPVVRGLDGDRIKILQNGTGVLDASAASQDHAVATDPLVVERIEVIQGPAALLYGSSTIGGAVNVVVKRIPDAPIEKLAGTFESRYSSNDDVRSTGLVLEGPIAAVSKKWLYHLDGTARGADDYKIPQGRVTNSFNRSWNFAGGTSYVAPESFAGVSVTSYGSKYGTVAEKAVNIDMQQQRFDFSGGLKNVGFLESAKLKSTVSNYQHQEISNGQTGTTFRNQGFENRLDLNHKRVRPESGGLITAFGLQQNFFSFEALGDEAFLPKTNNQMLAAFIFEEIQIGKLKPAIAARIESVSVASDVATDKIANFGASQTKNFAAKSLSIGFKYEITAGLTASLDTSYTERAPNYLELFANGPHVATGIFETGDKNLGAETSKGVELSLRTKDETSSGGISLFAQDFANFIALNPTGTTDATSGMPISAYQPVLARMVGGEIEYRHSFPSALPGGVLEIEAKIDFVRGTNLTNGLSLPRQPPLRESLALIYKSDRYQIDAELQRSEKQTDLAANERETAAYTFFNLGAEVPIHFEEFAMTVSVRGLNLFDAEAKNHVSVLKEIAPLPGRSLNLAVQATF